MSLTGGNFSVVVVRKDTGRRPLNRRRSNDDGAGRNKGPFRRQSRRRSNNDISHASETDISPFFESNEDDAPRLSSPPPLNSMKNDNIEEAQEELPPNPPFCSPPSPSNGDSESSEPSEDDKFPIKYLPGDDDDKDDNGEDDLSEEGVDGTTISSLSESYFSSSEALLKSFGKSDQRGNKSKRKKGILAHQTKLFGRDKEIQTLRKAFQRVRVSGQSEVILVHGVSGVGKSSLVDIGLRNFASQKDGYYCVGKFDPTRRHEPYSAIVGAFTDLCDLVAQQQKSSSELQETRQRIRQELRQDERDILISLVSNLASLVEGPPGEPSRENRNSLSYRLASVPSKQQHEPLDNRSAVSTATSNSLAFTRFKILCQKLLRNLASEAHPIVFVLDDLHWADKASLDVVKSLISDTDRKCKYVLVVGTYRERESSTNNTATTTASAMTMEENQRRAGITPTVSPDMDKFLDFVRRHNQMKDAVEGGLLHSRPLSRYLHNDAVSRDRIAAAAPLSPSSASASSAPLVVLLPVGFLSLGNVDAAVVNKILGYVTQGVTAQATGPLGEVVWQKTHGNPFFVQQFLHHLWKSQMLYHKDGKWDWDLALIQAKTDVSENVVQLVSKKIRKLHSLVQVTLQLAACLGSFFDVQLLQAVALADIDTPKPRSRGSGRKINVRGNNEGKEDGQVDRKFMQIINIALSEGLVEKGDGPKFYKFTHDRVQQCLYNMINDDQRISIHVKIGTTLRARLSVTDSSEERDYLLFLSTDQLNAGAKHLTEPAEQMNLIQMNMAAGRRAMSKSAYLSAAEYLRRAIGLLDSKTMWQSHYELSLELCTTSAVYESCSGNFDECQQRSSEVLLHARCIEDKMGAYKILMDTLGSQGQLLGALQLGLSVLGELGEKFPNKAPNNMHITMEMLRVVKSTRGKSDDSYLSLPPMTDKKKLATTSVLVSVSTFAFFLESTDLIGLVAAKMMRLTFNYGMSNLTPICYACWAMLQSQLGNGAEAYKFGRLSLALLEKSKAFDAEAMTLGIVYSLANHWQRPLRESVAPLQDAYLRGLKYGNIEHGVLSAFSSIGASVTIGRPLPLVEAEMREYYGRMVDFGQDMTALASVPVWQTILNLMGDSEDPLVLTGEAMNEEEVWNDAIETQNAMALHFVDFSKLKVACLFQAWELAQEAMNRMDEHKNMAKGMRAHFSIVECTFFSGLADLMLSKKKTGKRAFLRRARQSMKQIDRWHIGGKTDALPLVLVLQAEHAAATGGNMMEIYDRAISAASIRQFVHMEAYANERAGTILVEKGDCARGIEYLGEAKKLYQRWGAKAKVDQLGERIASTRALTATNKKVDNDTFPLLAGGSQFY